MALRCLPPSAPAWFTLSAYRRMARLFNLYPLPRRWLVLLFDSFRGIWKGGLVAWLKSSDTAAAHPIVIAPLTWPAEDREGLGPVELVNMLYGLVFRCATYQGQYTIDYVVPDAAVAQMAGERWQRWAELAAKAGYWARVEGGWDLVDDAEHLFHIRTRAEIEWEKARKIDVSNAALVVPVRLRDGDGCRYCGHIVQWNARRGNRAGTYDHRKAGKRALSPDDLVVACGLCNRTRGNNPEAEAWPLRPAPAEPHYGSETVQLLDKHGITVRPSEPASSGITRGDPAPSRITPSALSSAAAHSDPAPSGTTQQSGITGHSDLQISADPPGRPYPLDRTPGRAGVGSGRGGRRSRRGRGS